ncbi:MAG: IS66 family transposase [Planctomycetota bacterium]
MKDFEETDDGTRACIPNVTKVVVNTDDLPKSSIRQHSQYCQTDPETATRLLCEFSDELDQLKADNIALKADNAALRRENQVLRDEIQELKESVSKDSHNSSKPPSSDGLSKPKPKSLRPSSMRPTGGQPGHPGHTLRMVDDPNCTIYYPVEHCSKCGRVLTKQAPDRVERRQVFDIPEPKLEVTEYRAEIKICACGHRNHTAFPSDVKAPVQYGLRVKKTAVYLKEYHLLPFDRLAEIMRDLFACKTFSEGTLANFSGDCSRRLEPVYALIHALVAKSKVAGFDETGMRAIGSLHWLHTVSTRCLTWYFPHKRRGREAMDAANILPNFQGRAVHDFFSSYLKYGCDHSFCNSHLLRELVFLWEELDQKWAEIMYDHLLTIKTAVDTARDAGFAALPIADLDLFRKHYLQIVETGYAQNPVAESSVGLKRRGRHKQSKVRNLLDRFRDHTDSILAFMYDFSVPFDNNLSERDLRMMKLRQKISGTFRNFDALVDFCRIRSYVSTSRKNGLNALDALRRVFMGNPFVPVVDTT